MERSKIFKRNDIKGKEYLFFSVLERLKIVIGKNVRSKTWKKEESWNWKDYDTMKIRGERLLRQSVQLIPELFHLILDHFLWSSNSTDDC